MKIFICAVCGHVAFERAPEKCPVCFSMNFTQNDNVFKESAEKSKEASAKHIPSITVKKECKMVPDAGCIDVLVTIGKVIHPMEPGHHISFIDCYIDSRFIARAYLTPDVNPAACFHLKAKGARVAIVENCNIHGFWMAEATIA
jgi:superoxide reductase